MKKLGFYAVSLLVLVGLASCSQQNAEVIPAPDTRLSESASYAFGEEAVAALEAELITEGLQDEDTSNDDFLRMLQEIGGSSKFGELLTTLNDKEMETFLEQYGIGFSSSLPGEEQSNELTPQRITDCVQYFPRWDRNKTHRVGGHTVYIDGSGRPYWAERYYIGSGKPPTTSYNSCQTTVGRWGRSDDDGGHLISAELGGYNKRANIVPQNKDFNRIIWRSAESRVADCVKWQPGDKHRYRVYAIYPDRNSLRPEDWLGQYQYIELPEDNEAKVTAAARFWNESDGGPGGKAVADKFRRDLYIGCR